MSDKCRLVRHCGRDGRGITDNYVNKIVVLHELRCFDNMIALVLIINSVYNQWHRYNKLFPTLHFGPRRQDAFVYP